MPSARRHRRRMPARLPPRTSDRADLHSRIFFSDPSLAFRVVVRARQRRLGLSAVALPTLGTMFGTGAAHIVLLRVITSTHREGQRPPGALPNPGCCGEHAHAHFGVRFASLSHSAEAADVAVRRLVGNTTLSNSTNECS